MASNPPGKKESPKFPIDKIIIGQWNRVSTYPDSLVAKCYLGEKKLIWEILDDDATINMQRLKKKIEIEWDDLLSIRVASSSPDGTEILHVELRKPPTFHMETNQNPLTPTRWEKTDQDFTLNQARHTLHFPRGVLHENLRMLMSADKFWSDLIRKPFPTLPNSLYFEQYDNSNNQGQTLSFSVNTHQSQGFGRVQSGEGNFSMATQLFCPTDGRQINSTVQSNSENISLYQFLAAQSIPPSYQLNNEQGSRGGVFLGNNRLVQAGTRKMRNTVDQFLGAQSMSIQLSSHLLSSRRGGFLGPQFGNRLFQAGTNQMRNTSHQLREAQSMSIQPSSHLLSSSRGGFLGPQFGNCLFQAGTNQLNTARQLLEAQSMSIPPSSLLTNGQYSRRQAGTNQMMRNTSHQLREAQSMSIQPSSQLTNGQYSRASHSLILYIPPSSQLTNEQYSRGEAESRKPLFLGSHGSQTDILFVYGDSNSQGSGRVRVTHTWYDDGSYAGVILEDNRSGTQQQNEV